MILTHHLQQSRKKQTSIKNEVIYKSRLMREGKDQVPGLKHRPQLILKTSGTVLSHTDFLPGQ